MDASIFFKNGDVSEPRLNAEGSFKNQFKGAFADEQKYGCDAVPKDEPKLGLSTDDILNRVSGSVSGAKNALTSSADDFKDALQSQDTKISTGTWIAIGLVGLVVFGGLGYIVYKKYK